MKTEIIRQPLRVKNLEIHNRLVMAPMECRKTDERGMVSDEMLQYYEDRTLGGAFGLVITEHHFVSSEGRASSKQLSIADDSMIDGSRRLAELVHKNGSAIIMQLGHAGRIAKPLPGEGYPVSADTVDMTIPMIGEVSAKGLTIEEIRRITESYAKAALRAKEAGFDGVEIHAAHGYLLSQFYSPLSNHRTDEYGGDTLEGRLRFHVEVIRAVREAVGEDFVISIRFGAYDYKDNGSKMDEIPFATKILQDAGADILSISCGIGGGTEIGKPEEGTFRKLSELAKSAVEIPVITVGNIHTFKGAEEILENRQADLVAIGRPIFKNPGFARNMMGE